MWSKGCQVNHAGALTSTDGAMSLMDNLWDRTTCPKPLSNAGLWSSSAFVMCARDIFCCELVEMKGGDFRAGGKGGWLMLPGLRGVGGRDWGRSTGKRGRVGVEFCRCRTGQDTVTWISPVRCEGVDG